MNFGNQDQKWEIKKSDTPEWHHKPHFMGQMVGCGVKTGIGENMWYKEL